MPQIALSSAYGIQLSPTVYLVLAVLLVAAGLYTVNYTVLGGQSRSRENRPCWPPGWWDWPSSPWPSLPISA